MDNDYQKRVDAFNKELTPVLEGLKKKYNLVIQPQIKPEIVLLDLKPKELNDKEETKEKSDTKAKESSESSGGEPSKQ